MDTSAPSASTNSRAGRWRVLGAAAACLLVGVVAVLLTSRDDETSTVDAGGSSNGGGAEPSANGWTRLPDPPLSPRVGASAAWTGDEVIVVGGWEFLCPPSASCAGPTDAPFTDGAAFDPSTQSWRSIADAPAAFEGEHTAVVGDSVFLLVECEVAFTGIEGEPAEDRCPQSAEPTVLLRYDPGTDTWAQLPGTPSHEQYAIEAVGGALIAFAQSEERAEHQEWRFDLTTSTWNEIPDEPLPRMYDRSIVAADGGQSALLFGADAESAPSSEPSQEVNLAAKLDLETMTWTELPSSRSRGYRAWGVDDVVVLEPHFGGSGGLFDPASSAWSPLPTRADGSFDSNQVAGVYGENQAVYVDASGWVFDLERAEWLEIEPIDERSIFPHSSVTAVGRNLFSFGGERWTSPDGELLGDAWLWIAPASSAGDVTTTTHTPTTSTIPTTVSSTTSEPEDLTSARVLGGLTVRLEFESTIVAAGAELPSRLVVENRSDVPVTDPGCVLGAGPHALLPADSPDDELWLQPVVDCSGPLTFEPGFAETYDGPRFPAHTKTGDRLSPGEHLATIEIDGVRLSYPVTVTAP